MENKLYILVAEAIILKLIIDVVQVAVLVYHVLYEEILCLVKVVRPKPDRPEQQLHHCYFRRFAFNKYWVESVCN